MTTQIIPSALAAAHQENAEWHLLVGRSILFFGEIELILIKCLAHIPADRISETILNLNFSSRADLLLEVIANRSPQSTELKALAKGFKRAKELAKTRNLIAHNPVMLDLYVSETSAGSYVERTIRSARNNAPLRLANLKIFAKEVENLASSLWTQFGKIANRKGFVDDTKP